MDGSWWLYFLSGILLIFLLLSGFWIAFSLIAMSLIAYIFFMPRMEGNFPVLFNSSIESYYLFALPLYIFMGEIAMRSGLSSRLYEGLEPLFSNLPGGLLYTNVVSCAIFAAINGSTVATTSAIATVAIPELEKRGYQKAISYGSLATAGTLGTLIPPSIGFILFGILSQQSIGKLFIAGIIPGVILTILLMGVVFGQVWINPKLAPPRQRVPLRFIARRFMGIWPFVLLILGVLGSIYLGLATPTEAASLGVVIAVAISVGYGTFNFRILTQSALETVRISGMIVFLIGAAMAFGFALTHLGLISQITQFLLGLPGTPIQKAFGVWFMYIIMGMFLDAPSMIVITVPIVLPFMVELGFDPIWYGVLLTIACELGCVTPPVGLTLYAVQSITQDKFETIVWGTLPFWLAVIGAMVLVTFFPELALWLPRKMLGT